MAHKERLSSQRPVKKKPIGRFYKAAVRPDFFGKQIPLRAALVRDFNLRSFPCFVLIFVHVQR
jgi:hypothetical protein